MSTSDDMDEIIPVEIGHGGDIKLVSLGEFERYLTRFVELLDEMDKRDGGNPQTGATSGTFGGRYLTSTDINGLLIRLEVSEN